MLPEDEAMYLSIVFEETGAYQYKKNKEVERDAGQSSSRGGSEASSGPHQVGLQPGFEEIFSFGEDDPNDYWDKTIID